MPEPASVLVTDDNSDLCETFSLILKRQGFDADTASDGPSAVKKFTMHHSDVILLDFVMPEMNGLEAFRRIRQIDPAAKAILMTAYCEEELMKEALDEGIRCVISKPVKIDQMMEIIKEAVLS